MILQPLAATDIGGLIMGTLSAIKNFLILLIKIPFIIWFYYVPKPMRWAILGMIFLISLTALIWAIKHRNDWMFVYNR